MLGGGEGVNFCRVIAECPLEVAPSQVNGNGKVRSLRTHCLYHMQSLRVEIGQPCYCLPRLPMSTCETLPELVAFNDDDSSPRRLHLPIGGEAFWLMRQAHLKVYLLFLISLEFIIFLGHVPCAVEFSKRVLTRCGYKLI